MALRDAAGTPADPIVFASAGYAHFEVEEQARLNGWDESTTKLRREQYTDIGHKLRYEAWQQTDLGRSSRRFPEERPSDLPLVRDQIGRKLFTDAAPVLAAQINAAGGVGALSAPAADGSPVPPSRSPRGERNNNPGNLVKGSSPEGEISGADARFASFATPEHGIRALGKNLLAYQDKHGIDTVEGIISRWAPASENDTRAYVAAVAKAVGVAPGAKIDLHDTKTLTGITKAIIAFENGRQPYTDQQISRALLPRRARPRRRRHRRRHPQRRRATLPTMPPGVIRRSRPAIRSSMRSRLTRSPRAAAREDPGTPGHGIRPHCLEHPDTRRPGRIPRPGDCHQSAQPGRVYLGLRPARGRGPLSGAAGRGPVGQPDAADQDPPEADLRRMLDEAKPAPGEGFAARERNWEILGKAVEQVRKARQEDPDQGGAQQSCVQHQAAGRLRQSPPTSRIAAPPWSASPAITVRRPA